MKPAISLIAFVLICLLIKAAHSQEIFAGFYVPYWTVKTDAPIPDDCYCSDGKPVRACPKQIACERP